MTGKEQRERLYGTIGNALSFMRSDRPAEEQMTDIRRRYPEPVFYIEAGEAVLERSGLSEKDAFFFSMIPGLARLARRESFGKRPRLCTLSAMSAYLKTLYIGVHAECFYTVLLDARGYLIDAQLLCRGTTDRALFCLKDMLLSAAQSGAAAVVMCHNHPCGTPRPSKNDIDCTLQAIGALSPMGIALIDHVIIAGEKAVSLRDIGAISAELWYRHAHGSRLFKNWLDRDIKESELD